MQWGGWYCFCWRVVEPASGGNLALGETEEGDLELRDGLAVLPVPLAVIISFKKGSMRFGVVF